MHHANHFYGHAHVMARYVGSEVVPRIWGYLQHGWNMHDGFAVGTVFAAGYPKFVWSQACVRRGHLAGLRDYMVVAAPWLYLLEMEDQAGWLASGPEREGTIVYPFHGWEGQQVSGDHLELLREVREVEGDVAITVCLHWNEYDNPKVRSQYEDAGVRVITHGQRGYLWKGTEPAFLYRQLAEIRRHRRVVSNRMSSAVLYAAAAGTEVGVYGDPMELEKDHAVLGGAMKPRRLFPEFHEPSVDPGYAAAVAAQELGADEMLSPEEVLDVFRWTDELGREPRPWPPAPPLEEDRALWLRRSRNSRRGGHLAPVAAEPSAATWGVVVAERPTGDAPVGPTDADPTTAAAPATEGLDAALTEPATVDAAAPAVPAAPSVTAVPEPAAPADATAPSAPATGSTPPAAPPGPTPAP